MNIKPKSASTPAQAIIIIYPHRIENGNPMVRIRFVKSTAMPPHTYASFNAWSRRMITANLMLIGGRYV